jgi:DNA modification methylase
VIGRFEVPGYHVGDCRALLAELPDESVHCVVTSPPYWGLRDYLEAGQLGLEATPEEYVAALVGVFREVRRVLQGDGTLWLNLGDSYAATSNGPQGKQTAEHRERWGKGRIGGKHETEFEDRRQRNVPSGLKPKDLVGIPWRVAFALQADGWWLRSDIIWAKPNPMPESVTDRPTKAHEYLFLLAKSESYHYDADAIRESHKPESLARYEYGLTSRAPADGFVSFGAPNSRALGRCKKMADNINPAGRNRRSVWTIATEPTPDAHFATFPRKLVEPCILAGCPPGGVVLDPFGGSGTVGRVAEDHGRNRLLFDLSPAYAKIAKRKTAQLGLLLRAVGGLV